MYTLLLLGFDCVWVLRFVFIVSLGVFDFVLMAWVVLWVIVAPAVLLVLVVFVLVHFDCCLTRWVGVVGLLAVRVVFGVGWLMLAVVTVDW